MAQYSGFFNDVNNDRLYGANELSRFYRSIAPNGLYTTTYPAYPLTNKTGMTFDIGFGEAMIDGYFHAVEGSENFSLAVSSGGLNRIDILCLRLDKSQAVRAVQLVVKQGTAATNPTAPPMADTGLMVEIPLYEFYVPSGVTQITGVTVTDLRNYSIQTQARNFMNARLPNTNLNFIADNGLYYVDNPALVTNNPTNDPFMLEVFRAPTGRTIQRVTEMFAGSAARHAIFQRATVNNGSTWSAWTATYSDKQQTFSLNFTGGVSGSGSNFYSIIGDRVRIEAIGIFPSGLAGGATIGSLTTSARPSTLTYIAPIMANNGQRVQLAIQPNGDIQSMNAITSNTSVSIFDDFLRTPIR